MRELIEIYSEDEVYLDPDRVRQAMERQGFIDIETHFMTPRFNPDFLGLLNKVFAHVLYTAGAMGSGINTQSYFAMSGRKC